MSYIAEKDKRNTLHRMEMGISHYYASYKIIYVIYIYILYIYKVIYAITLHVQIGYNVVKI